MIRGQPNFAPLMRPIKGDISGTERGGISSEEETGIDGVKPGRILPDNGDGP